MADCKLLQLPLEIRMSIYRYVFSTVRAPRVHVAKRPRGRVFFRTNETYDKLAVLHTCKTIYQEFHVLFAVSVRFKFDVGAQPSNLPLVIQQKYIPHTKHVTLNGYDEDRPLDVTPFTSLEILYILSPYAIHFPGPQSALQWLSNGPTDSRGGQLYADASDLQLGRFARERLLEVDAWMKALVKNPARKYKIVFSILTIVIERGLADWIDYDMDSPDTVDDENEKRTV